MEYNDVALKLDLPEWHEFDAMSMQNFVEGSRWINSKTYEKTAPHEYIFKYNLSSIEQEKFYRAVLYIRDMGVDKKFYSKTFRYLHMGNYKFWTYGDPAKETYILNRAKI